MNDIKSLESCKKLLNVYRNDNMMLNDKCEHLICNIKELKGIIEDTSVKLTKAIEKMNYWKHKHDKKSAFFTWGTEKDMEIV